MRRLEDNPWITWFKVAIWIGIIANLAFAIPALITPYYVIKTFHLPWVKDTIWLRDAGGLLFFLSLMYIGAACDPFRYRLNAALAVVGRLAFAAFWFWCILYDDLPRAFLPLGIGDGAIGVLQTVTYLLMMRYEYLQPELPDQQA